MQAVCASTKNRKCLQPEQEHIARPNLKLTFYFDTENNRKKNKRQHFYAFLLAISRFHSKCLVVLLLLKLLMTLCVGMRWRFSAHMRRYFLYFLSVFVCKQSTLFAHKSLRSVLFSLFYLHFFCFDKFFMYFSICTSMRSQLTFPFANKLWLQLLRASANTTCVLRFFLFRRERQKEIMAGRRDIGFRYYICTPIINLGAKILQSFKYSNRYRSIEERVLGACHMLRSSMWSIDR